MDQAGDRYLWQYLTFRMDGLDAEIAVISNISVWWMWLVGAILLLGILTVIIRIIIKIAKPQKKPMPESDSSEEDAPVRIPPTMKKVKRKKGHTVFLILLAFLVGIAATAAFFLLPGIRTEMESVNLIKDLADRDAICMDLSVTAKAGNRELDFAAQIQKQPLEGKTVTAIRQNHVSLVYADGTVFLENGKAFRIGDEYPDYSELLDVIVRLYENVDISRDNETYTIAAKGQNAAAILELLIPDVGDHLSREQEVTVELKTADGEVSCVTFAASGALGAEDTRKYEVEASLEIDPEGFDAITIPAKIRALLSSGSYEAVTLLTEDLLVLAEGWKELDTRELLSANLTLDANCGPLVVKESLKFYRWNSDPRISSVQKNGYALYFTETSICDKNGKKLPLAEAPAVEGADLLDIAYRACMNAEVSSSETDKERILTVALDKKGKEEVACAIAPEAGQLGITFEHGSVQIVIRDGKIHSIHAYCDGAMQVVIPDVSVSFGAELVFTDSGAEVTIPYAVENTLKNES